MKYGEKVLKRFLNKHKEGDIALKICECERNYKLRYEMEFHDKKVDVRPYQDDEHGAVYITLNDHGMIWYVWRDVPYKPNRYYYKIVPAAQLDRETIANILEAEPWLYL